MSITWESFKGSGRNENRDFGFYIKCTNTDILMVIDGGNKGDRPKGFVDSFAGSLREAIKALIKLNTPEEFIKALDRTRESLKGRYSRETLCYSVLLLNHNNKVCWGVSCGDCRIGSIDSLGEKVVWRTNVHTLANWDGQFFSDEHMHNKGASVVTRCFSLNKDHEPEIVQLSYDVELWCLATDGYWLEKQMQGESVPSDDTSLLVYGNSIIHMEINNLENFYYENL